MRSMFAGERKAFVADMAKGRARKPVGVANATRRLSEALVRYQEATVAITKANQKSVCSICRCSHVGHSLMQLTDKTVAIPVTVKCVWPAGRLDDCPWGAVR